MINFDLADLRRIRSGEPNFSSTNILTHAEKAKVCFNLKGHMTKLSNEVY